MNFKESTSACIPISYVFYFFYLPIFFSLVKLRDNTTIPIMATIPSTKLILQQIVVNFSFFTELAYSVFSFVWSISTISTISVGIGIKEFDQQVFAEKVSKYRVVDVLYTRWNRSIKYPIPTWEHDLLHFTLIKSEIYTRKLDFASIWEPIIYKTKLFLMLVHSI